MHKITLAFGTVLLGLCHLAAAEPVFHKAENNVQVAVTDVSSTSNYTEIRLQAQQALGDVCWYFKGQNSPYLVATGRHYRFLGGDGITNCPSRRNYSPGGIMVLRFERLGSQDRDFSLVEGEGGEGQMTGATPSSEQFWNFLKIKLR